MIEIALTLIIGTVLVSAMALQISRRKEASRLGAEKLRLAVAEGQTIPLSLHPVIDPTLCVGSFSCIKSCPEGEIIGVVDGVATLVEAAHCIGHGQCEVECPVGAIKLVFGTAEMGIDLPRADDTFESSRPGVYIVGELGGMGLIKNALRQGLLVGKSLKARLKKSQATETLTDVLIIGGGPAGIATAVACKEEGLDARILEQDTLGGAIAHYPRGKVVMTEQIVMPGYGPFGRSLLSKEDLLEDLRTLLDKNDVLIEEGQRVVGIHGEVGAFSIVTAQNHTVQARAVVLAIGLRGTPRKLNVPGEDLPKVVYRLIEPEQFHGKRVLVVGGGDSAVEAAIQLAEESTAKVAISYRQDRFNRVKARNREKITRLIDEGRIKALLKTRVVSIDATGVRVGPVLSDAEQKARDKEVRLEEGKAHAAAEKAKEQERRRVEIDDPDVTDPSAERPPFVQGQGAQGEQGPSELRRPRRVDRFSVTGSFRVKPIEAEEAEAPSAPPAPPADGKAPREKTVTKSSPSDKSSVSSRSARAVALGDDADDPSGAVRTASNPNNTSARQRPSSASGSGAGAGAGAGEGKLGDSTGSVRTMTPDDVKKSTSNTSNVKLKRADWQPLAPAAPAAEKAPPPAASGGRIRSAPRTVSMAAMSGNAGASNPAEAPVAKGTSGGTQSARRPAAGSAADDDLPFGAPSDLDIPPTIGEPPPTIGDIPPTMHEERPDRPRTPSRVSPPASAPASTAPASMRAPAQPPSRASVSVGTISRVAIGDSLSKKTTKPGPGEVDIKNDFVIVSIGGQLPTQFLNDVGVGTRTYKGEERSGISARPGEKKPLTKSQVETRSRRRLALTLFLIGLSILVGLVLIGEEYYWLPLEERTQSPLHPLLKPSGLWGHGVGVAATTFMIANFLYALRKRWGKLKGTASIRTWLTFHMFVGIMSPLVIAFHAAFLVNNLLAVWTWVALSVVVGTGIFGRFLFSFVPAQAGKVLAVSELREKVAEMTRVVQPAMAEAADFRAVTGIFDRATDGPREKTLVGAVVRDTRNRKSLEADIEKARVHFKSDKAYEDYKKGVIEIGRAKMQLTFYAGLKRIFRAWLVVHVIVALFMVVLIGAHVAVTTYLGFTWIFSEEQNVTAPADKPSERDPLDVPGLPVPDSLDEPDEEELTEAEQAQKEAESKKSKRGRASPRRGSDP